MFFRSRTLACAFLIGLLCRAGLADPSPLIVQADSALSLIGMNVSDFISDRIWAEDDSFLLPSIRGALKSPLEAYGLTRDFAAIVPETVEDLPQLAQMAEFTEARCPPEIQTQIDQELAAALKRRDPFEPMLTALTLTERYRAEAFARLSPDERQAMLLALPLWFEDEDIESDDTLKGALHRTFRVEVDTTRQVDSDSVLTLLYRVDRQALTAATYAFTHGIHLTVEQDRRSDSKSKSQAAGVEGDVIAVRETPLGRLVIGGTGPNIYRGEFALILDWGGDDRYFGHAGGVVGEIGIGAAAVIDFDGDDFYDTDAAVSQGAGILGFGALLDLAGDDVYRAGDFSQGAAFCGAGIFYDGTGDDTYRAGMFAQSAAVCGVALMLDGAGRDLYDLAMYGQGFASTFACAALVDRSGNDVYRAGGSQTHAPLLPEDFRSFAQGFAIGSRPRGGGGIGLLHDLGGNDFYDAEVYAQGVGYWYSLGALLDDAGNDVYCATQYVQGAGIHLAAGVLEDGGGDDRYTSRFGPGQAGAHDLAVALFYEHGGDDQYSLSGGQGMAITNSAALFYDARGNDSYNTTEPDLGQGGVREARGFGSLGVFVDGEGRDYYAERGKSDSTTWLSGLFAVGRDVPYDSVRPREAPVTVVLAAADTLRTVEELFRDASRWEVTDNRERVKRARLALEAKWNDAVPWVGLKKLNTLDGLERRAIVELFKAHADLAADYLLAALDTTNTAMRRNAVAVLGEIKYKPAVSALIAKLADPSYERMRPSILSALGEIGDTSAVPALLQYIESPVERERIASAVSLGKLKDPRGWQPLLKRLEDSSYTVQSAAIAALGAQKPDVRPVLDRETMTSPPVERLEQIMLVVGRLATAWKADSTDSLEILNLTPMVLRGLQHTSDRVKGAALVAAASYWRPAEVRRVMEKFRGRTSPVLAARIKQTELILR